MRSRLSTGEARILWAQLGWRPLQGGPAPDLNQGPIRLIVIAPWCPDCRELGPELAASGAPDRPTWLVGEFSPPEEVLRFAQEFGISWPILQGTSRKNEVSRNEARFRDLRWAWGDERRWGVPTWIEGELRLGWLHARRLGW